MEEKKFDVIIIGGGIMGSCTAYEVSKHNLTVLLLEQFDFLHHLGSSHGESRTIRAAYPEPFYSSMVRRSLTLWEKAEEEAGYRVRTATPHFDVGPSHSRALQRIVAHCNSGLLQGRLLGPEDVGAAFSGVFSLPDGWIGVASELGGVVRPAQAVAMFQTLARKRGAVLKERVKVTDIDISKDDAGHGVIRVSTDTGEIFHGAKCVVTAGAWTRKLVEANTSGDVLLPIKPLETSISYWKIRRPHEKLFTPAAGFPTFASYGEPSIYGTPAIEFPGLVKICLHGGRLCDPDGRKSETGAMGEQHQHVREWIERVMPEYVESAAPAISQPCMYSMTPDGDFVIDYLGREFGKDLVVVGGFSGHGFKMAPLVGSVVAGMVVDAADGAEEVEMGNFRIGRFVGNPKGNAKDHEDPVSFHPLPNKVDI